MKLLTESKNPSLSFNGGSYATGYEIHGTETGCVVRIDRCYGSDYEGDYIHEYELPVSPESAESIVIANRDVFAAMCNGNNVKALIG